MQRACHPERQSLVARLWRVKQTGIRRHRGDVEHIRHEDVARATTAELTQKMSCLSAAGRPLSATQPALAPLGRIKAHAPDLL